MANRPAPALMLREGDREELTRWTRSTSMRAGLVMRARIVLAAAAGEANERIAVHERTTRTTVLKWRTRYQARGLDGLVDEPRPGRPRHVDHRDVVAATLRPPPKKLGCDALVLPVAGPPPGDRGCHRRAGLARVRGAAVAVRDVQVLHRP